MFYLLLWAKVSLLEFNALKDLIVNPYKDPKDHHQEDQSISQLNKCILKVLPQLPNKKGKRLTFSHHLHHL